MTQNALSFRIGVTIPQLIICRIMGIKRLKTANLRDNKKSNLKRITGIICMQIAAILFVFYSNGEGNCMGHGQPVIQIKRLS
jgi:hypothetical protein